MTSSLIIFTKFVLTRVNPRPTSFSPEKPAAGDQPRPAPPRNCAATSGGRNRARFTSANCARLKWLRDNDTIFQGPHAHPDVVGRVSRLCLSLGVVPVFVVPHEFGFQSMVENSNGTWQAKVWARFQHGSLPDVQERSQRSVSALHRHRADRIESAPRRRAVPERWRWNLQSRPHGRIISLRRTSAAGSVEVLGRSFEVDPHWLNRLVRVEVDLDGDKIRISRLRRREPRDQPLLRELQHHIKIGRFRSDRQIVFD